MTMPSTTTPPERTAPPDSANGAFRPALERPVAEAPIVPVAIDTSTVPVVRNGARVLDERISPLGIN